MLGRRALVRGAVAFYTSVLAAAVPSLIGIAHPAAALGSYPNARIADVAMSFWNGKNGSAAAPGAAACNVALAKYGYSADSGGQCRAFVNCVVVLASKNTQHTGSGSNYFQGFTNAGGIRITDVNQLAKGDIVQVGDGSNPDFLHTYIIENRVSGNQFMIVDSNHNPQYPETVNYYERTVNLSKTIEAFRMGTVTSPPVITSYTGAGIDSPWAIALGPDGALWFTNTNGPPKGYGSIGRITTSGVVSTYTDKGIGEPDAITAGPDGALWFTNTLGPLGPGYNGSIGRITTSGVVSTYADRTIDDPQAITVGPDDALWFTNWTDSIGRITTSGVITNYVDPTINTPQGIAVGPDGALWFANYGGPKGLGSIGRITTSGVVTNYTGKGIDQPVAITAGPDGALWFTNANGPGTGYTGSIGRITTSGTVTDYRDKDVELDRDGYNKVAITVGPDGALWFTNGHGNGTIGRITTTGKITSYTDSTVWDPIGITTGPDHALWFTNFNSWSIGRITTPG